MRPVALYCLALLLTGCSPEPPGRTFLLLTIDTLRADRLGAYGCERGNSPALDALAAESMLFTDCLSVSSWTMPAMGTLATGLRPSEHGMVYWHLPLADVPETLSEILERGGVKAAFFGNPIPRLEGLDRGFRTWETFDGDDAAAVDAALAWLRRTGGDRFLWVHLLSPHGPYDPLPATERPAPELDPRTVAYDAEIRTVDLQVARLLQAVGPDAAVIATADHGETLDGRGELEYDHGKYLYRELLRVPLMVRHSGLSPGITRAPVTIADVPVTACEWFGLASPGGSVGRSLRAAAAGELAADPALRFAWVVEDEPPARTDERWAVRAGPDKAVFNLDRGTAKLFDLGTDPQESRDLAGERTEEVERLRDSLEEWRREAPGPEIPFETRFSAEELERLQAVGYLGGAH
ncbi:MAG TPA: sulfatase [bacterium]|nr:sulfatase [bacterium]